MTLSSMMFEMISPFSQVSTSTSGVTKREDTFGNLSGQLRSMLPDATSNGLIRCSPLKFRAKPCALPTAPSLQLNVPCRL